MKKLCISAFLAVASLALFAQPSLTSGSVNPAINDSIFVKAIDSAYVQGPNGANQTWNYSNMTGYIEVQPPNDTLDYWIKYRDASTMPDYSKPGIGNSTVAEVPPLYNGGVIYTLPSASNILMYGSTITVAGLGAIVLDMDSDPAEIMNYPFTYLSNITDAYAGTAHSGLGTYPFTGAVTVSGDAYGTLTMPFMSGIPNVLRVHAHDSTFLNAGPPLGTFTFINDSWDYYEPGFTMPGVDATYPLLSFHTSNLNGATSSWVTTQLKVIASVTEFTMATDLNVYPNPAEDRTNFTFNLTQDADVGLNIVGAQGQVIREVYNGKRNAGAAKFEIPTNGLASGYYFIQVSVNQQKTLRKLIVK